MFLFSLNSIWTFIASLVLFFILSGITAYSEQSKYTREQCIVRVNIDWDARYSGNKENVIRKIGDAIGNAPDMGFNEIPPSSAIQGDNRQFIFYQYKYDCENRLKNTEKLLIHVRSNTVGLPPLEVDKNNFQPGVDTIRSSGPWWSDGG